MAEITDLTPEQEAEAERLSTAAFRLAQYVLNGVNIRSRLIPIEPLDAIIGLADALVTTIHINTPPENRETVYQSVVEYIGDISKSLMANEKLAKLVDKPAKPAAEG